MGNAGKGRGWGVPAAAWVPTAVLIAGLAVSGAAFWLVRNQERVQHQLAEQRRAADATSAIFLALQVPVEAALTLPAFLSAGRDVTQAEFQAFTRSLLERHRSLTKLQWAVRVSDQERAAFEARWGITIRQPDASGAMVRAPVRADYFPILHVAPADLQVVGLDVAFDDDRRRMLEHALATGRATLSPRFRLVEDPPDVYSVAVNAPLRRVTDAIGHEDVVGLGAALFHPHVVVAEAVQELSLGNLRFVLRDASEETGAVLIAHPPEAMATWDEVRIPEERQYTRNFNYLDRRWQIQWRWDAPSGRVAWVVLAIGVLVTLLATGLVALRNMMSSLRSEMSAVQRLGNYRLGRKLGEGGMGTVYFAHHAFLRRPTAVKVIRPDPNVPELFQRFEREARYTSRLTHPNTISIFDYGQTEGGVFYYAMEYVPGLTLRELVKVCGALPLARVKHIMLQVAGSLSEAHAQGILHRDIKPENVMVAERGGIPDFVKVLDFGLVKDASASADSSLSVRVALLGTPGYIAPETISDAAAFSPASDVYSLGALLYFLVTGKRVFQAGSKLQLLKLVQEQDPARPSSHLPQALPSQWEAFIIRCLRRDPAERPLDASEFRLELAGLACPTQYSETDALQWWSTTGAAMLSKMNVPEDGPDVAVEDIAPSRSSFVQSRAARPQKRRKAGQSAT